MNLCNIKKKSLIWRILLKQLLSLIISFKHNILKSKKIGVNLRDKLIKPTMPIIKVVWDVVKLKGINKII